MNTFRLSLCRMLLVAAIATIAAGAVSARAGDVPTRTPITNVTATAATWTVPAFANGWLDKSYVYDLTSTGATVTVAQVIPTATARTLTNTLASVYVAGTSATITYTNASLVPGDIVRYSTDAATGQVVNARRVSTP